MISLPSFQKAKLMHEKDLSLKSQWIVSTHSFIGLFNLHWVPQASLSTFPSLPHRSSPCTHGRHARELTPSFLAGAQRRSPWRSCACGEGARGGAVPAATELTVELRPRRRSSRRSCAHGNTRARIAAAELALASNGACGGPATSAAVEAALPVATESAEEPRVSRQRSCSRRGGRAGARIERSLRRRTSGLARSGGSLPCGDALHLAARPPVAAEPCPADRDEETTNKNEYYSDETKEALSVGFTPFPTFWKHR